VNKEKEGEIKCLPKNNSGSQDCWKASLLYPELLNLDTNTIFFTEISFGWHCEPMVIMAWTRTTLAPYFKTKILPLPKELN